MKRARVKRQRMVMPEVSLTPLIDTALTLLIIFMITTPMMNNVIKVELPSSSTNEIESHIQQEIVVSIDKSKKLYLNGKEKNMNQILSDLKGMNSKQKIDVVFVKADQAVSYGKVIDLVDTIKTAGGIKYVALATKRSVHE